MPPGRAGRATGPRRRRDGPTTVSGGSERHCPLEQVPALGSSRGNEASRYRVPGPDATTRPGLAGLRSGCVVRVAGRRGASPAGRAESPPGRLAGGGRRRSPPRGCSLHEVVPLHEDAGALLPYGRLFPDPAGGVLALGGRQGLLVQCASPSVAALPSPRGTKSSSSGMASGAGLRRRRRRSWSIEMTRKVRR